MDLRDAPRNASIPSALIRLRILPVTTGVAPLYPSRLTTASTPLSATLYPEGLEGFTPSLEGSVILCLFLSRLCFHKDTNPFSRNPFIFTSMQNPAGCGGPRRSDIHTWRRSDVPTFRNTKIPAFRRCLYPEPQHLTSRSSTPTPSV